MQKPSFFIPSYKDSVTYEDYRLRIGDRIYVRMYSTDDKLNAIFNSSAINQQIMGSGSGTNSTTDLYSYLIDENGFIYLPMVGNVFVKDKTIREATVEIENSIRPLFSKDSKNIFTVELKIIERYFSIVGSSVNGLIQIPREKINIFQALALAGDIGAYGDKSKIKILRETENGTSIRSFDFRSQDIVHSEFFYVEPNDVIYVQNLDEQFFSITDFPTLLSTIFSTTSFGVFIYKLLAPTSSAE